MKRVLIIGENSYIGTEFAGYIRSLPGTEEEIEVMGVGARSGQWENISFAGVDVVLHLAALVHQKERTEDLAAYREINYHLPLEVAKKSRKAGVKQFIFMSTAAVYGNEIQKITKDTPPNPNTLYGKSKLAAEKSLLKMKTLSFSVAVIRPPMVYGRGCKGNYTRLVKLARFVPVFPDVRNRRSMIGITNLCEFLRLLILNGDGGYYFPQDQEMMDTSNLVKMIWNSIGKNGVLVKVGKPFGKLLRSGFGGKINVLKKLFGDFCYEEEMSVYEGNNGKYCYQISDLQKEFQKKL